ncbi:hypothetical protein AB0C84_29590 [Actinomadura sp. NPDC048955]
MPRTPCARDGRPPAAAYGHTFWWAVALSALTLVPALFYPSRKENR